VSFRPSIGARLGHYVVTAKLGSGGMAEVVLARDERLERPVALKLLSSELADDPEFRERFVREARIAAALEHPNVVPIYDAGEIEGLLFIAMRYIVGRDLREVLSERPVVPEQMCWIVSCVARALDAAHEKGLVHRDVKPGNVLIGEDRPANFTPVFLTDFGVAWHAFATDIHTRPGAVMGTIDYAAPEQLSSKPIDGRVDQYALACIAFECLAGVPPFHRDSMLETVSAHLHEEPATAGAGAALDAVLRRGLAKDRADRFPSCTDLADALEAIVGRPATMPAEAATRRATVTVGVARLEPPDDVADPEIVEASRESHARLFAREIERFGGSPSVTLGGEWVAAFGTQQAQDDDALRALRALDAFRAAARDASTGTVHIGVATGVAVIGGGPGGPPFSGPPVRVAAELARHAGPAAIVMDDATKRIVGAAVETADADGDHVLQAIVDDVLPRDHDAPMVGRTDELRALRDAVDRATTRSIPVLATIVAEPGAGKSRLARALLESFPTAVGLYGRSRADATGFPYWPIAEALGKVLDLEGGATANAILECAAQIVSADADADRIAEVVAAVLGAGTAAASEDEVFWAIRRFLRLLGGDEPVILVMDDVQWADATLIDLIDALTSWETESPLVVLCLARPELLEQVPTWGASAEESLLLRLPPLGDEEVRSLVSHALGNTIPSEIGRRLTAESGGNPLFLQELVATYREEGVLAENPNGWQLRTDSRHQPPPVVQAVVAARLDRLPPLEHEVVDRAAVFGESFAASAIDVLLPTWPGSEVSTAIRNLRRRGIFEETADRLAGTSALAFRHLVLRDVAYERVAIASRVDLHAGVAGWLEATGEARATDELAGYHLERAAGYARQLGREQAGLSMRAAVHLERAGFRALDLGDMRASSTLLDRASTLRPDDAHRVEIDIERAAPLRELGEIDASRGLLGDVMVRAQRVGDDVLTARARLALALSRSESNEERQETIEAEIADALGVLERHEDRAWLARGYRILGTVRWWQPDFPSAVAALDRGLGYARAAGDRREEETILSILPHGWLWGETPATDGLARIEPILADPIGKRVEGKALQARAGLSAMTGAYIEARDDLAHADAVLLELGMSLAVTVGHQIAAIVELLAEDLPAAEQRLEEALEQLEAWGDDGYIATTAALLAIVRSERDDVAGTRSAIEIAVTHADADEPIERAAWGPAQARVLIWEGQPQRAIAVADEAASVTREAGLALDEGLALLAMADAHLASGDRTEARGVAKVARDVFAHKEVAAGIEWADMRALEASRRSD
jgi:tRNA A-37 threonylcarbamoyl transferase component Bud32